MRSQISSSQRKRPRRSDPAPGPAATGPFDEHEISVSVQAHDGHFLERTLRCKGADLNRAMRLYHHAPSVKQLLKELVREPHPRGRLAIPLRDAPPSPHVIVTEGGVFVTCLAEHMSVADLPVVPYERFVGAMDRADREVERFHSRQRQLKELSMQALLDALWAGPGHVTREMIEVFDRDPETYVFVVCRTYIETVRFMSKRWVLTGRAGYASREAEIAGCKALGRALLCIYLLGFIHAPNVLDMLLPFVNIANTGMEVTLGMAIARHPGGPDRLLDLMEKNKGDEQALRYMSAYMLNGCTLNPDKALGYLERIRALPLRHDGWDYLQIACETLLCGGDKRAVERIKSLHGHSQEPVAPAHPTWLFSDAEMANVALANCRASLYFPPAEKAPAARAAWAERLRQVEPWRGFKAANTVPVRKETRTGRNDPCPCGSGKKYKQCCIGKPSGPTPEEVAAEKMAARKKLVEDTMAELRGKFPAAAPPG